eukprot:755783-Hanusia_phi.AAC.1
MTHLTVRCRSGFALAQHPATASDCPAIVYEHDRTPKQTEGTRARYPRSVSQASRSVAASGYHEEYTESPVTAAADRDRTRYTEAAAVNFGMRH